MERRPQGLPAVGGCPDLQQEPAYSGRVPGRTGISDLGRAICSDLGDVDRAIIATYCKCKVTGRKYATEPCNSGRFGGREAADCDHRRLPTPGRRPCDPRATTFACASGPCWITQLLSVRIRHEFANATSKSPYGAIPRDKWNGVWPNSSPGQRVDFDVLKTRFENRIGMPSDSGGVRRHLYFPAVS